jgi:putative endonuclease
MRWPGWSRSTRASDQDADARKRRVHERRGALSEYAAAAALMAKGYRILNRRWSCHLGEIDLVAVRGKCLAFVEVKQRGTIEDGYFALTEGQSRRIRDAAEVWLSRRRRYQDHDIHFDAVIVLPWRWPRHEKDAV